MMSKKDRSNRTTYKSKLAILVAAGFGLSVCGGVQGQIIPSEYRWWALNVGAYAAHNQGSYPISGTIYSPASTTGKGAVIAVVDSGVIRHSEFQYGENGATKSRVLLGKDYITVGGDGTLDGNGHGTHVAGIAAAGLNSAGVVGIAPDAWILPVRVLNATGSGSWANTGAGVNWAVNTWASSSNGQAILGSTKRVVVSMSLGGTISSTSVFADIKNYGAVGVVAAGNDGRNISSSMFAYQAVASKAIGNSIIVGAVDSNNSIASFSNKPGKNSTLANYFIVAPGASVDSTYNNGGYATMSGTSMATPVVSGAAAVVWGAWPYLSAKQVVDSLLLSAKDIGAKGVDAIYGRGLLDVQAAMRPIGGYCYSTSSNCTNAQSLSSGFTSGVSRDASVNYLSAPAAAGVAVLESSARIVGYDSIGRHFFFPVAGGALKAGGVNASYNMDAWLSKSQPVTQVVSSTNRVAVQGNPNAGIVGFSYRQSVSDSSYVMAFKGGGVLPFGLGHSDFVPSSFVAGDNMKIPYLGLMESPAGMAYGREFGGGLSLRLGHLVGRSTANETLADMALPSTPTVSSSAMLAEVSKRFGQLELIGTMGSMREDGAFLGANSPGRYTQGSTTFTTLSSIYDLGAGFAALAIYTRGQSRGLTDDRVADYNAKTKSYSLGLLKSAVFSDKDRLSISLSMPSRVASGGVTLYASVDVNMETGAPIYGQIPVSLSPQGREQRWELSWMTPLKNGNLALTALRRLQPNHDVNAPAENVFGARYSRSF